jgi:Na+-translocating ferredoxin:NAD+ oxidoreductase RnfD subunit
VFWYAAAGATVLLYRRTRSWWWPVAWLATVPATSTVVGVLLYAPHP